MAHTKSVSYTTTTHIKTVTIAWIWLYQSLIDLLLQVLVYFVPTSVDRSVMNPLLCQTEHFTQTTLALTLYLLEYLDCLHLRVYIAVRLWRVNCVYEAQLSSYRDHEYMIMAWLGCLHFSQTARSCNGVCLPSPDYIYLGLRLVVW